ncbi:hypothetical protein WJX72_004369 [[Myrmecia] bisecta]|uniref:Uncharacterized protein n=1 Tax=[Myrmecia] bisecta TaxID=41462 RepID=A0AAW1QQ78_9CHLO
MATTRALIVAAVLLGTVALASAQLKLVGTTVPGKVGVNPGANFCQAVVTGETAWLSGSLAPGANITAQTAGIMDTFNATLTSMGSSLESAVKATVMLTNISDFQGMNNVYRTYFKVPPARSTFQVAALASSTGLVEIELECYDPAFSKLKAVTTA